MKKLFCFLCVVLFLGCEQHKETSTTQENVIRVFATSAHITPLIELLYPQGIIGLNYKPYPEDIEFMPENIVNLPILGGFDRVNFEQLVALKPDLIIFPKGTDKAFIEPYEKLGIKTLQISTDFDDLEESLLVLGKALSVQDRANKLLTFYKKQKFRLDELRTKVKNKPKIYFAYGLEGLKTHCAKENDSKDLALIIGGENAVKCKDFASKHNVLSVNYEFVIALNPEVIFVREIGLYKELMNEPSELWQRIQAVQNKKIYYAPSTPSNWLSSPPSAMKIIGLPWAFSKLHPELLSADEMKTIAKEFFAEFLRPISDDEYARLEGK